MKIYRQVLVALTVALVVAVPAAYLVRDPGYVLLQYRDTVIETSMVFAAFLLVVIGLLLAASWWALRWPLQFLIGGARRRGRQQYQRGIQALAEGRSENAEELLLKSSKLRSLKLPALIGAYDAARARGDAKRQSDILKQIDVLPEARETSAVLRAELELAEGRAGAAIELLTSLDQQTQLPPAGIKILLQAYCERNRAREAIPYLIRLRKSQVISAAELERIEIDTLTRALEQASDAINLRSLWAELSTTQRADVRCVRAYALRAGALRLTREAMNEIETSIKTAWSDSLALTYGLLPAEFSDERLSNAETWFSRHSTSRELLLTLGRLARQQKAWGKTEEYLRRAMAEGAGSVAWEELAHAYAEQGDAERARVALENTRALERGDKPHPLTARTTLAELTTPAPVAEERNEHGVPFLPGAR